MPEMFQQILHYMNTALTSLFACEACLKIYAYGFRVRNRQQTAAAASCGNQSHYIEVTQGAIFMEQKIRFGLSFVLMAQLLDRTSSAPLVRIWTRSQPMWKKFREVQKQQ